MHGGDAVPVVILHAATGSTLLWEKQTGAFRAGGLPLITYDRLGYGRSVLSDGTTSLRPVEELEALVAQFRLPRFHLLGVAAGV
jgi:pimeloyl-ACP methyl ester carboxylesterase